MANALKPELEDPPSSLKSPVWEHFCFAVKYDDEGKRQVDKTNAVCRHCSVAVGYVFGSTSNLITHMKRHHPNVVVGPTRKNSAVVQSLLPASFKAKEHLAGNSDRAKAITKGIGVFIAADQRPYSVVENSGFKHMMKVIEPRYVVPSRPHFSEKVIPALYDKTKSAVIYDLSRATAVALTTDGWTSRATEGYITVTEQHIDPEWNMVSNVLQTRPIYDSHTSANLAEGLKEAVLEWKLERPGTSIPVTTDNARNIVKAVTEAGLGPQIGCFAHTINLASQKAIGLNQVCRLLGKVRRIVSFFHRSTTAAHILESKQVLLMEDKKERHKLIHDVPTRWNSSYDMVERYLEQQVPVFSALTSLKKKDISSLSDQDVRLAEDIIQVLKPLKTVTTLMSTESMPSVSMILPLKTTVLNSMTPSEDDSPIVRDMKAAIRENLDDRYSDSDCQDFLHKATALDPRFKTLSHVDTACRDNIYSNLITEIVTMEEQQSEEATGAAPGAAVGSSSSPERGHPDASDAPPPAKKSVMAELFGDLFKTQVGNDKSTLQLVEEEVNSYKTGNCIALESNPLKWWKENESIYPHVAKMAKRYLAVPATSVASERVFSTAGDIVTASRSALNPENVDKLVFLSKNMKVE